MLLVTILLLFVENIDNKRKNNYLTWQVCLPDHIKYFVSNLCMRRESAAFRCRRYCEAVPFQNGYVVEAGKLTNQAIRINMMVTY